ncbi:MAG: hypothetical protein KF798_02110 [Candidatus Paracaedibacteraceae bacterium]|nr:hypothetical protein [Candidatus Paracaedibacteraceae bacterium]
MLVILSTFLTISLAQESQNPNKTAVPCQKEPKCGSMLDLQRKLKERRDEKQQSKIPTLPTPPQPASQSRE